MDHGLPFFGSYDVATDSRGRITLPTDFAKHVSGELILSLGTSGCLVAFPPESYDRWIAEVGRAVMESNFLALKRMVGSAMHVSVDNYKRFVIPDLLRTYLQVATPGRLVLLGQGSCFEIWKPESFVTYAQAHLEDRRLQEEARLLGINGLPG